MFFSNCPGKILVSCYGLIKFLILFYYRKVKALERNLKIHQLLSRELIGEMRSTRSCGYVNQMYM